MQRLTKALHVAWKSWPEIHAAVRPNETVLLDIDGVLAADGDSTLHPVARDHALTLARTNPVFLVTNGRDRVRAQRFAEELGIPLVHTTHRKPSRKILAAMPHSPGAPYVVIGDKLYTDGLFARNIGGRAFLMKERLVSKADRLIIKLSYIFDDTLSAFLSFW